MKNSIPRPLIFKRWFLVWMLWIGFALSLKVISLEISRSILLGGSVAMAPSLCFAWLVFKYQGASQNQRAVSTFYRAEGFKFILTAGLFILVFTQAQMINVLVFFAAFVIAQIVFWLVAQKTIS